MTIPSMSLSVKQQADAKGEAQGGWLSSGVDHSNWNVQIGSGLNIASPSSLLLLAAAGVAIYLGMKWAKKH